MTETPGYPIRPERHLSDKEKRWLRAHNDAVMNGSPHAAKGRRYGCEICGLGRMVHMIRPASEYAHRGIYCEGCEENTPHYPIGGRDLSAVRRAGRHQYDR